MWHKTDDSQEESTEDIHGREKVTYLEEAEFTPEAEEWGVPVVRRPTQDKASLQDDTSQESYPEMERRTKGKTTIRGVFKCLVCCKSTKYILL